MVGGSGGIGADWSHCQIGKLNYGEAWAKVEVRTGRVGLDPRLWPYLYPTEIWPVSSHRVGNKISVSGNESYDPTLTTSLGLGSTRTLKGVWNLIFNPNQYS